MQPAECGGSFKCEARLHLCLEAYGQFMAIRSIFGILLALLRGYAYFEPEYLPANMRTLADNTCQRNWLLPNIRAQGLNPDTGRSVIVLSLRIQMRCLCQRRSHFRCGGACVASVCDADEDRGENCAVLFGYLFRCAEISACKYVFDWLSGVPCVCERI